MGSHKQLKVLLRTPKLIYPLREWAIGLFVSVTLFIISTAYIGYDFYMQYQGIGNPTTITDESVVTYQEKIVSSMLALYRERETEFNRLREEGKAIVGTTIAVSPNGTTTASTTVVIPLAHESVTQ